MFRSARQQVVVAGAKYKLGADSAPGSQDGYQIFAYSHLATFGGHSSDVAALLYPIRAGGRPRQLELVRLPDRSYSLWLVYPSRHV